MSAIVEIQGLSKQYGKRKAVDDVSMTIESGEIFGLVGPNGAGKTTTMRMLVTLLRPDKGEIPSADTRCARRRAKCAARSVSCPMPLGCTAT
jgi:ABC-2 type transport system ATP-binding protein